MLWATGLIGSFYLVTVVLGLGARAILGTPGEAAAGKGGNLAVPVLAQELGGGAGTTGATCSWRSWPQWPSPRSSRSSPGW